MDIDIVGSENLPNVYIGSIGLRRKRDKMAVINATIHMYDHTKQIGRSWNRSDLDLKIKVCLVSKQDKVDALLNGNETLYSNEGLFQTRIISSMDMVFIDNIGDIDRFSLSVEFDEFSTDNQKDVSIFCSTFIDGFGFENELFNEFYGPMSGEKILINNQVVTDSGYFMNVSTGEEYSGPVHKVGEKYYQGSSVAMDNENTEVIYVPEENFKISAKKGILI